MKGRAAALTGLMLIGTLFIPPADSQAASSRLKFFKGRFRVTVVGATREAILDSLASASVRRGYELLSRKDSRIVLDKEASLAESRIEGGDASSSARKRLWFEATKPTAEGIRVLGAIELVVNPGVGERVRNLTRTHPYRDELRAILDEVVAEFDRLRAVGAAADAP